MTWALDLDGVVWRGDHLIDGSNTAINHLASIGTDVVYVTNSSWHRSESYVDKLRQFGIDARKSQIIHGGHAVAQLAQPGETILVCAGNGVKEGLDGIGNITIIDPFDIGDTPPPVDAVIVGWIPSFDYRRLALATRAVLNGARLLATNMDPLYPKHDGFVPGTGSLVSAITYATKATPSFGGKPNKAMVDLVNRHDKNLELFVGDQPMTDGRMAQLLDVDFALVWSGVTTPESVPDEIPVAITGANLAEIVTARS